MKKVYVSQTEFSQHLYTTANPNFTGILVVEESEYLSYKYFKDGFLHRDDGPAVVINEGDPRHEMKAWYQHGKIHRDDGPALMKVNCVVDYSWKGRFYDNEEDWKHAKRKDKLNTFLNDEDG